MRGKNNNGGGWHSFLFPEKAEQIARLNLENEELKKILTQHQGQEF